MDTLTFHSRYDYTQGAGIEVPITLKLTGTTPSVRLLAKVDTGASFCIFQREYAEQLGINVETGVRQVVATANGHFITYGHPIILSCLHWEFETIVYFAEQQNFTRNVVGRSGWLQNFRVGLIDHDASLFLSHYDD